jgi:hypothetical protein
MSAASRAFLFILAVLSSPRRIVDRRFNLRIDIAIPAAIVDPRTEQPDPGLGTGHIPRGFTDDLLLPGRQAQGSISP